MASVGFGSFDDYTDDFFNPTGDWESATETSFIMSAGSTLSYNSILGPVNFDLSWVNGTNNLRVFLGVGFHFN